jgi:hypothetical protein
MSKRLNPRKRPTLRLESLESRVVLQGQGIGNPFEGIPDPPFETPPVDAPAAPPTNGRPVIVHPLGGPGRPDTTPPDPQVPPFGEPEASALVVGIPPGPPEVIPPVDLPDQVPIDVPPAPPTNGRPVIVHPLGGPGRPDTTPPDPQVPPFGEPEASALVANVSRTAATTTRFRVRNSTVGDVGSVDAVHSQPESVSGLSVSRSSTTRRSRDR